MIRPGRLDSNLQRVPSKNKSHPLLMLASLLIIASACDGADVDELHCGPGTTQSAEQCVLAGGGGATNVIGEGGSAGTEDSGVAGADMSGTAGMLSGGEGGERAVAGSSAASAGAHSGGMASTEAAAGSGGMASTEAAAGQASGGMASTEAAAGQGSGGTSGDVSVGGAGGCIAIGGGAGEAGAPDLGESATVCTAGPISCTPQQLLPTSGAWPITQTDTVIALSDTTVVLGNAIKNSLDVLDLCTGKTRWSWQLPAAPGVSVLDRERRVLYVTLVGATSIAMISLDSACVELIDVPFPAISLALGDDGQLLARLDNVLGLNKPISIIDVAARRVLATRLDRFNEIIAFSSASQRLFAGSIYGSVQAYEYNSETLQFTAAESSPEMSYPCSDLELSPDQNHLFFACVGSVTPTTAAQGADLNAANLALPFGVYDAGASTTAATYSAGTAQLFAMEATQVASFDVATRTRVATYPISSAAHLSIAPSGRVLIGGGHAPTFDGTWTLSWSVVDTPDCKP
jgi:hypothetical protein